MKKLLTFVLVLIGTISCEKDEIPGVTGEYVGTYYKIDRSTSSVDEMSDWYNHYSNWPNSHATVTVTISKDDKTMKILIDSDFGRERIMGSYTEQNGIYKCENVTIKDGEFILNEPPGRFSYIPGNSVTIRGKYLKAYQ